MQENQIDFVITSPPYINVFNYHQNYRQSAEILGWDLLKIAKSEIGSNRANRGNRFYTIIQFPQVISKTSSKNTQAMTELLRPHYTKLTALLSNPRLPNADKKKLEEALIKYGDWINAIETIKGGQLDTVEKLVEATNRYKRFIELDLIFDSSDNFLYRQKGQLKLDDTILEEFLPQLVFRSLRGIDDTFELGPRNTFSGLSFLSSIGNLGQGGEPSIRTKAQDFILGKKLYLKSSFDPTFQDYKLIESHLGYVCAECKTNLDKTIFQEAVATSIDLKIAVPGSL